MARLPSNTLFGLDAARGPGLHPINRRGRGATLQRCETVELHAPNFCGRRKLIFRYRPLKRWQSWDIVLGRDGQSRIEVADQLARVEAGIIYYFKRIGGFRIADDRIVRLFYEALDHFADEAAELQATPALLMTWAIDAKADSLKGETPEEVAFKRAFIGHPDGFLDPSRLDTWLDKSEACCKRRGGLRAQDREKNLHRQIDEALAAGRARRALTEAERIRQDAEDSARLQAEERELISWWKHLPRDRQFRSLKAVEQNWKQQCDNCGEKRDSDLMQDLLRLQAANWARDAWPPAASDPSVGHPAEQNRDREGAAEQNRNREGAAEQNPDREGAAEQNRDREGAAE